MSVIALREVMATKVGSVDPAKHRDETFELFSIPAYDVGRPDYLLGAEIGSTKKEVSPGDVLLSRIVPHIRRSWIVGPRNGHRQIASGEWMVFRGETFYPAYLRHYLLSDVFHAQFMMTVAGVGGSLLRARPDGVASIKVPLPALTEQKRIAAILDKTAGLSRIRSAAVAKLELMARTLFRDRFESSASSTVIQCRPLMECAEFIQIGPFGSILHKSDYVAGGIPLINPMHIVGGEVRRDLNFSVDEHKYASLKRYHMKKGDIVMGRRGEMGRCAVIGQAEDGYLCGTGSLFIRPKASTATAVYLKHALSSRSTVRKLEAASAGVTMPNLNAAALKNIAIPVPSIEEQREFERALATVERLRASSAAHLAALEHSFTSLQHRAFHGEL